MFWRNLSVATFHGAAPAAPRRHLPGLTLVVAVVGGGAIGCGGHLPGSPDATPVTISGYVYHQGTPEAGEPLLADVLITVQEAERSPHTVMSDGVGFYTVAVRAGIISITASKVGYATRVSSFDVSNSTVLNFSLTPS